MGASMMRVFYASIMACVIALASLASTSSAATTFWLSSSADGAIIPNNTINVPVGGPITLYAFVDSSDTGNTFEFMVGYDKSNAGTYGPGSSIDAATGKLTLSSTKSELLATIPANFNQFALLGYADAGVVLNASGRETANYALQGRPFGFLVRAATTNNTASGKMLCFSFTLRSNMAAGDSQRVVLSNNSGGNSYSSAWKHGTTMSEASYVLNVITENQTQLQTIGIGGKSLRDTAIMTRAAPNYIWVLWGMVSQRTENSFVIDDGSGVSVTVIAEDNSVVDGNYVSVRGTLDMLSNPPTLTSQQINIVR